VRQAYIKQSVILNCQVCHDKTSGGCYIPTHCPSLPANVTATLSPPIGRMDSAICDEHGGCVRGEGTGRCACGRVSLQPPLVSLPPRRPPCEAATHRGLSGAGTRTDGWAGNPVHSLIACVLLHTKTTLLQYYEQFHAVTK